MAPVFVAGAQGLFDEEPAKSGAIDEEVAFDDLTGLELEPFDESRVGVLRDMFDLAFDALYAVALRKCSQELRVHTRVEMVRIVDLNLLRGRELLLSSSGELQAIIAELGLNSFRQTVQPEVVKLAGPSGLAGDAKRMDVGISRLLPSFEVDPELERCRGCAHELLLIDLQQTMKAPHGRNRRLTDSDGSDLLRLHQRDIDDAAELVRERRCSEPSGCSPAGDDELTHFFGFQCFTPWSVAK